MDRVQRRERQSDREKEFVMMHSQTAREGGRGKKAGRKRDTMFVNLRERGREREYTEWETEGGTEMEKERETVHA